MTTKTKRTAYTPGPWLVLGRFQVESGAEPDTYVVGGTINKPNRTIAEVGCWRDRDNAEADARLIAKAPEMAAMLPNLIAWIEDLAYEGVHPSVSDISDIRDLTFHARALLAEIDQ